ncbi:MAG TPA: hypothetical protein VFE47_14765 [Tepidisphaeraceae bacterium]|nr:hypothetical protein [Tepidisphaeraceae bacterium]
MHAGRIPLLAAASLSQAKSGRVSAWDGTSISHCPAGWDIFCPKNVSDVPSASAVGAGMELA